MGGLAAHFIFSLAQMLIRLHPCMQAWTCEKFSERRFRLPDAPISSCQPASSRY